MSEYYPGMLWVYHANVLNDASNSGNHVYTITIGAGEEIEILYGSVYNGDAAARALTGNITDGTNVITELIEAENIAQTDYSNFPQTSADMKVVRAQKLILGGGMKIVVTVAAVAVSKNTRFAIVCRIWGRKPTVAVTKPTGATLTTNTDKVV